MAAGIMNTLLGGAYSASAASDVVISSMTLVSTIGLNTRTGASYIWISASVAALYLNIGAAATATNHICVIAVGAPVLVPAGYDYHVLAADTNARVAVTYWR